MRKFNVRNVFVYCAAATALFGGMQAASAITPTPSNGWIITGPSGAGGSIFVGNGNVGALSTSTNVHLSGSGGDLIILNPGGVAVGNNTDTIIITTSNDKLLNFGVIAGENGVGNGGDAFAAISVTPPNMLNDSIINYDEIIGGAGTSGTNAKGGDGGDAVRISTGTVAGGALVNYGLVAGGNGASGGVGHPSGNGGYGLRVEANTVSNSSLLFNAAGATISGGNGGNATGVHDNGGSGADAVHAEVNGGGNDALVNNGLIMGGIGGSGGENGRGGSGGDGLFLDPATTAGIPKGGISDTFINTGTIAGGKAGSGGKSSGEEGTGVLFEGSRVLLINLGTISGGQGYNGIAEREVVTPDVPHTDATIGNFGLGDAIVMEGNSNTIVLGGHSTTTGLIVAEGDANTNILKLEFTGVSPAEQVALEKELQSLGVLSGTQSSGSFSFRGSTIAWDPLVVVLKLSSYQLQSLTPNQAAVGANLDSFQVNPKGDMLTVLNALDASGNVPAGLEALSPQRYQIFGDIALADANFLTLNIDQRLNNLRDGSESIDTTGIGGDTAGLNGNNSVAGWTKDDSKDGKGVEQAKPEEKRWGFFGSGDVVLANFDGDKDLGSSKFTSAGLVLGLDGKINDNWVVGSLFSYQYTSAAMDGFGSTANVDSYTAGLYSGYHNGGYYANGLLTYTRDNYDTERSILLPGLARFASATTHGNQFTTDIDGGYDFKLNEGWSTGPIAGLQYVHLGVDDFNEAGAGAEDLAVSSADVNSLRSRLGARINYNKQVGKEVAFSAEGRAEWQHEFLDDSRAISGNFIGSGLGGFAVQTSAPQRDAALVGAGLNVTVRNRMTIFADYDVQAGQQSYFEQSVRGGLKFSW